VKFCSNSRPVVSLSGTGSGLSLFGSRPGMSSQPSAGPFQMPSASHRTRRIGGLMFSVGHSTTVKLLSGMRMSFRWATKLIRSMTVRRRSLFSWGRRATREAKALSRTCDGGRIPEKLGNARVDREGGFRKEWPSRGPDGSDTFPLKLRAGAECSSIDFLTFVSVSMAASK
jgi:hypothetical protein